MGYVMYCYSNGLSLLVHILHFIPAQADYFGYKNCNRLSILDFVNFNGFVFHFLADTKPCILYWIIYDCLLFVTDPAKVTRLCNLL